MARPRIRQFAGDLGISYDKAKGLINEGRRRKDGGSQVLESSMNKIRGYEAGGTLARAARKLIEKNEHEAEIEKMEKIVTEDTDIDVNVDKLSEKKNFKRGRNKPRRKADGGTVYAESGKYMSCRGMGAAVQGNKFTGVK